MKTLEELKESIRSRIGRNYSSDMKLIPTGKPGETSERTDRKTGGSIPAGYRMVRARAVTWDRAPSSIGISAPKVGDSPEQDKDAAEKIYTKYYNYYKKYIKGLKKSTVKEEVDLNEQKNTEDAPFVLVLKRITTRTFPGNINVALYYNDKLNKYFAIPYGKGVSSSQIQSEEVELVSELSEHYIVSNFLNTFNNLTEANQIKMLDMLEDNASYDKLKFFILSSN